MKTANKSSDRFLLDVLNTIDRGLCVLDERLHIVLWSDGMVQKFKIPRQDAQDSPLTKFLCESPIATALVKAIKQVLEDGCETVVHCVDYDNDCPIRVKHGPSISGMLDICVRPFTSTVDGGSESHRMCLLEFVDNAVPHSQASEIQNHKIQLEEANRKIKDTNQKFQQMFLNHAAIMCLIDPVSYRFVDANYAAQQFYGYSIHDFRNITLMDVCTDEAAVTRKLLRAFHVSNTPLITRHKLASGRIRDVEIRSSPITTHTGEYLYFAIITDVTDRRNAEKEIQKQNRIFNTVIENMPAGVFVKKVSEGYRFALWNHHLSELLGLESQDVVGKTDYDLFDKKQADNFRKADELIFRNRVAKTYEETVPRQDKELQAITTKVPIYNENNEPDMLLGFIIDQTEQLSTRKRLRERDVRYRALYENSSDGILLLDDSMNIVEINPALFENLCLTRGARDTIEVADLIVPEKRDDVIRKISLALDDHTIVTEFVMRRGDFSSFPVEASIKRIDKNLVLVIVRDISERKDSEMKLSKAKNRAEKALSELKDAHETLVQTENMALLGQLVAGVAHEINTPIGTALTAASHLAERTKKFVTHSKNGQLKRSDLDRFTETAKKSSQLMMNNLERAAEQINGFKQVAVDQTSARRREFELKSYVQGVLDNMAPRLVGKNVHVSFSCQTEIYMDSYPGALFQVLSNLMMNALLHAFDAAGGEIEITIELKEDENDDIAIITFADTGKGMSKKVLAKIFDPFFTTRRGEGGTGLGLSIAFNVVNQTLGGRLSVQSKPDKGTRFTICIPTHAPENIKRLLEQKNT